MKCPLCGKDLADPVCSPSVMIRTHLALEHLAVDETLTHSHIQCVCGTVVRGLTSLARHITKLSPEDSKQHGIVVSLGGKPITVARTVPLSVPDEG